MGDLYFEVAVIYIILSKMARFGMYVCTHTYMYINIYVCVFMTVTVENNKINKIKCY